MSRKAHLADHDPICSIVGKRIKQISRGDFLIDGIPNDDDMGPLEIAFEDGTAVQTSLISDGESVTFKLYDGTPPSLKDQNSEWRRVVLSNVPPYNAALGVAIITVEALLFGIDRRRKRAVAGYIFALSNGHYLYYYNAGDYAKIYFDSFPLRLPDGFSLEAVPLSSHR